MGLGKEEDELGDGVGDGATQGKGDEPGGEDVAGDGPSDAANSSGGADTHEGGGFVNEFDVLGKLAAVTLDTQEINAGGDVFDVIEDVVEAVGQVVDVFAVDGGDKGAVGFVV